MVKYYCDRCKKEIKDKKYYLEIEDEFGMNVNFKNTSRRVMLCWECVQSVCVDIGVVPEKPLYKM